NVCDNATAEAAKSADCKTVVTRAEFERLLNAVAPQIPANARRQVATKYANLIVMAHEARKMGLDKGPHYEEPMKIGRMQVLQQEAFTTGGLKANPPSTELGKVRRSSLPADQGAVFDLKSGEVSQLISGPNGYFVYKVGEKDTLPLEKVHEEIHNALRQQKMQDSMQAVQQLSTPVLDEKYFAEGSAAPQQTPIQPGAVKPQAKVPESGPK